VLQSDPYALKVTDDARIVQGIAKLDQLERVFNTAQTGMGFTFRSPHPKPIDTAARREPEAYPIGQVWFERWFCSDRAVQILPRFQILQAATFGHDEAPRIETFLHGPPFRTAYKLDSNRPDRAAGPLSRHARPVPEYTFRAR
jgi:hypothetical protein